MISLATGHATYEVADPVPIPIYTMVSGGTPWRCFGQPAFEHRVLYRIGEDGRGCRCAEYTFCPHTSCTHLETAAHVCGDGGSVGRVLPEIAPLLPAYLVDHGTGHGGQVGDRHATAVIVRTGTVAMMHASKRYNFTGTNPPFLTAEDVGRLYEMFPRIKFLLVDLPSVDPEQDGGRLAAHHAFFSGSGLGIVELCNIPAELPTGAYLLNLNVAPFDGDATPCAPTLYRCTVR